MTPATRFFAALYADQTGVLELRTFGPEESDRSPKAQRQRTAAYRLRDFVLVNDGALDMTRVARFLDGCTKNELGAFFGVALRTLSSVADRKGDAKHCQTLTTLFVDADFKHLGEAETRKQLAEFSTSPSLVVDSGGGLHPYWLLRQPLDLQTKYEAARTVLQSIAYSVAAIVDTSVSEPARVLRIPGSLNFKYDPPRPVTLAHVPNARIDPADLPLIEMTAASGSVSGGTLSGNPLQVPQVVVIKERHPVMRDLMRSLQARGVPLIGALAACQIENKAKCRPPLDDRVLEAYLRRVAQLPDRFERTHQTGWELAGGLIKIGLSVPATLVAVRSVTPDFDPEVSE